MTSSLGLALNLSWQAGFKPYFPSLRAGERYGGLGEQAAHKARIEVTTLFDLFYR